MKPYIACMEDVLETYERPYDPTQPMICLDEKPVTLHADVRPAAPAAPGREARHDSDSSLVAYDAKMHHVKKATIRDLRYRFSVVEAALADGEEIEVTRRKRVVARLLPPKAAAGRKRPDFLRRLKAIYGGRIQRVSGAQRISEERSGS